MGNYLESWDSLNEGNQIRGKQILISPLGVKQKIAYKVQSHTQFMIKLIRMDDIFDSNGTLTPKGASSVIKFFNSQLGLVNTFGVLDSNFFRSRFLIYKVVRDTDRVEKVQFTVIDRRSAPEVDSKYQFVSTDAMQALKDKNEILSNIVKSTEDTAKTDNTVEEPGDAVDGTEKDAEGSSLTRREAGSKFRYTMGSNGKTYLMEFTEDGAIEAVVVSGGNDPNGAISWENPKVMWYTDLDNNKVASSEPLYIDSEISDKTDKDFLTKIFTDDDFLDNIIAEYKEKYEALEFNAKNLKSMLYYNSSRERIFPSSTSSEPISKTETGSDSKYGIRGSSKSVTDYA